MLLNFYQICYIYIETLILLISFTIELYCTYDIFLFYVKTPDLGSLFLTFNNFVCVLLQLVLFRAVRQINLLTLQ